MLGMAVLMVEAGDAGVVRPPRAVLSALFRGARTPVGLALLALALTVLLGGWWVVSTGGLSATVFGQEVSLRGTQGPIAFGALLLFLFVEVAFWQERVWLAAEVPRRARFLWNWLLTPMIAWILVPFTWRLQTLAAGAAFGSDGVGQRSPREWLLYYPRTAWEGWLPSDARWLVLALLCGSIPRHLALGRDTTGTASARRAGPLPGHLPDPLRPRQSPASADRQSGAAGGPRRGGLGPGGPSCSSSPARCRRCSSAPLGRPAPVARP